ncbi:MAG TPA: aldolase/citrate lyase family protein [Acidimicrobiales bacterium]|nr:aldolase/citrate lyase family protein [Acidimicrobiales bacterium]
MTGSDTPLLARAHGGAAVWGIFVKLAGTETVDLASAAGFDFIVVDVEHSQLGEHEARRSVRHAAAIGLPAVVRVAAVDPAGVNLFLEAGATGVQLSGLRSCAQVRALVAATRYPPDGRRSVSLAQPAAGYGVRPLADHLGASRAAPALLAGQIESGTTDDDLTDIAADLDVLFIGPTDLSVDLGLAGALDHPVVTRRMAEIASVAAARGAVLGGWAAGADGASQLLDLGARYLVIASDLQLLGQTMTEARQSCMLPPPPGARR